MRIVPRWTTALDPVTTELVRFARRPRVRTTLAASASHGSACGRWRRPATKPLFAKPTPTTPP